MKKHPLSNKFTHLNPAIGARLILGIVFLTACTNIRVIPPHATATASFSGTDGIGRQETFSFTLVHDPADELLPRARISEIPTYDVNDIVLTVTRGGLPIEESFIAVSISQGFYGIGSDVEMPIIESQDPEYIRNHIGYVTRLKVDLDPLDSPLSHESINPFPGQNMSTGYAMLARWEWDDSCLAFQDSEERIDVSRLVTEFFDALKSLVTLEDESNDSFSLGGIDNDGDFEMFFVPHVEDEGSSTGEFPSSGFTFIFKATVYVPLTFTEADIYIPLTFLFTGVPGPSNQDYLDLRIDLLQFSSIRSEDRNRVTVIADGLLPQATAVEIRQSILGAIDNMPREMQSRLDLQIALLSALVNSIRPDGGIGPLSETVRVVLFPNSAIGPQRNVILSDSSDEAPLRPILCILD